MTSQEKPAQKTSSSIPCPQCKGNNVEVTQPGWLSDMLFILSMLFVMSNINKGDLYKCQSCGKKFRSGS